MKHVAIETQVRTKAGKGVARKLRRAGQTPGVLYGPKAETISLSVNTHEFNMLLNSAGGEPLLFTLNLGGNGDSSSHTALIKDLQLHPVDDKIRHIDFYEVLMDEEVQVEVPITAVGKAKGVEADIGVLEIIQRAVKISCLPLAIPRDIQINVSDLGLGEAVHVADIKPPEGIRLMDDPETTLMTIVASRAEEEEEKEEEAEIEVEEEEEAE
ncbi:MAG: 50S ribosomal protein L25 [Deltaproteobacteria bacterium]|nr:50S ribosomal protein L25 [Deltaproteobacteria bacterium]MDL1961563.1 50S ribosomal protein L25 [Deltaproteobacteria bacterium]